MSELHSVQDINDFDLLLSNSTWSTMTSIFSNSTADHSVNVSQASYVAGDFLRGYRSVNQNTW